MKIAVLAGDGIGPEITAQAQRVLAALASDGLKIEMEPAPVGGAGFDAAGDPLPAATLAIAEQADAILFGAVGGPKWDTLPRPQRPEQGLLRLRKHFDLFANLRPAIVYPELAHASSLKPEVVAGLDILILRELTGDIYFGQPRGIRTTESGEREGFATTRYTEGESRRIPVSAFEAARNLFVISRGPGLGVAQEMALKLKETCAIHAEAFSAAEVEHGPASIVRDGLPVLMLAPPAQPGPAVLGAQASQEMNRGRVEAVGHPSRCTRVVRISCHGLRGFAYSLAKLTITHAAAPPPPLPTRPEEP